MRDRAKQVPVRGSVYNVIGTAVQVTSCDFSFDFQLDSLYNIYARKSEEVREMPIAVELRENLYVPGRFTECFEAVEQELESRDLDGAEREQLEILAGWCLWRRDERDSARERWRRTNFIGGLAYAAATLDKDDDVLLALVQDFPDDMSVRNAFVIRARDADSTITHEAVREEVLRFRYNHVEVANLYNNAGRFFLDRCRASEDLVSSLGFFDAALGRYGTQGYWHHRGGVHYWRSRILEVLFDKQAAVGAAIDSFQCWTMQVVVDPSTQRHREMLQNAQNRLLELVSP